MARYPQGQPVRVSTTVRDVTGALVNATTLTLVVKHTAADGTLTTTGTYTTPVNDSTGAYHQDIPAADLALLGHYTYVWTATGTGAGAVPGDFDVYDPFEQSGGPADLSTSYCTAEELKIRLGLGGTTASDDQITVAIAAASRAVDGVCERYFWKGPDTRTYIPRNLYETRVDDLVSVTLVKTDPPGSGAFAVTWAASDYQLLPSNVLNAMGEPHPYTKIRAVGSQLFPWVFPLILARMDRVQVTGVFGWPQVPQPVRTATLIAASELFRVKDAELGAGTAGEFMTAVMASNPLIGHLLVPYARNPFLAA